MRRVQHAPDFAGPSENSGIMPKSDLRLIVEQKREGAELTDSQWESVVDAAVGGGDPSQIAALFMACYFRGMTIHETVALTRSMVRSGDVLRFTRFADAVDKHSSGGVGDTASLVLVPLLAECGERVAKLSGRALGHTGGTLDKLESIPGLRVELTPQEFEECIARAGCAIAAQSNALVPADKVLYALRDRTGTVPCPGLIAASIVAKKIAGGADRIVFDVKMGSGAFMKNLEDARALATLLVNVAAGFERPSVALITDMNQPLSPNVGNGIEIVAAREFLAGRERPKRMLSLVKAIATALISLRLEAADAAALVDAALQTDDLLRRFESMIEAQGGDVEAFRSMEPAGPPAPIVAGEGGFVSRIDCESIGNLARRAVEEGGPCAGIRLEASIGDPIGRGDRIGTVFGAPNLAEAAALAVSVTPVRTLPPDVVYETVTPEASNATSPAPQFVR